MSKKSQAALEFLTTYAWAFVAITITLGALYSFGVFDFGKYIPQKCIFPSQFKCADFSLGPADVRVKLVNNIGENVKVDVVEITNEAVPPVSCTIMPVTPFDWGASSDYELLFSGCSGGNYLSGDRVQLKFRLRYYAIKSPSMTKHWMNGVVDGRVR
jgi:hypothetical protein